MVEITARSVLLEMVDAVRALPDDPSPANVERYLASSRALEGSRNHGHVLSVAWKLLVASLLPGIARKASFLVADTQQPEPVVPGNGNRG